MERSACHRGGSERGPGASTFGIALGVDRHAEARPHTRLHAGGRKAGFGPRLYRRGRMSLRDWCTGPNTGVPLSDWLGSSGQLPPYWRRCGRARATGPCAGRLEDVGLLPSGPSHGAGRRQGAGALVTFAFRRKRWRVRIRMARYCARRADRLELRPRERGGKESGKGAGGRSPAVCSRVQSAEANREARAGARWYEALAGDPGTDNVEGARGASRDQFS